MNLGTPKSRPIGNRCRSNMCAVMLCACWCRLRVFRHVKANQAVVRKYPKRLCTMEFCCAAGATKIAASGKVERYELPKVESIGERSSLVWVRFDICHATRCAKLRGIQCTIHGCLPIYRWMSLCVCVFANKGYVHSFILIHINIVGVRRHSPE